MGNSISIYNSNTFEEIKTLPTKDYSLNCYKLLNQEILALSIGLNIEFWSLKNYQIISTIKNIYTEKIINYKKDKIICSTFGLGHVFYIIDTKLFIILNIFKSINICYHHPKFLNGFFFWIKLLLY